MKSLTSISYWFIIDGLMQKFLPRILFGLLFLAGILFRPAQSSAYHTTFSFPTIVIPTIETPFRRITPQPTSISSASTPTPTNVSLTTSSPTPTGIRYATPTPTKIIVQPTPTATPISQPTNTIAPTQLTTVPISSDEKKTFIMNAINDYRRANGLYAVRTSSETCSFAATRAKEITTAFNHDGFRNRINNGTLPYKSWSSVTENLAMTSNYKQVVSMWINSAGHAANMRKDTPFVCVENAGNYYAYEGMKP
jgi:uncharacterized protein YkwD